MNVPATALFMQELFGRAGFPGGVFQTLLVGSGNLSGGIASFTTTSALGVADHPITASYAGDGNFSTSVSTSATHETVSKAQTTSKPPSQYSRRSGFAAFVEREAINLP